MIELKVGKADDAMDVLTFISSLVGSISWPIATFTIAFVFRVEIRHLLNRLKKLTWGERSVDFGELLAEAEKSATDVFSFGAPEPAGANPADTQSSQPISPSPAAAIDSAWRHLETEVKERALPLAPKYSSSANYTTGTLAFPEAIKILFLAGEITPALHRNLYDLYELQRSVAHGSDIKDSDAIRFRLLANQALYLLLQSRRTPDNPNAEVIKTA